MTENIQTVSKSEFDNIVQEQNVHKHCYAFICPMCGTIQSMASLVDAGVSKEKVHEYIGFSCEGRWREGNPPTEAKKKNSRGCNWTLGGLFQLHNFQVQWEDGHIQPFFSPANKEQAKALEKLYPAGA